METSSASTAGSPFPQCLKLLVGNLTHAWKCCAASSGGQTWWTIWTPKENANFANLQNKRTDSLPCSFLDFRLRRARSTPPRGGRGAPRAVSTYYSKGLKSQLEASVCTGAKI